MKLKKKNFYGLLIILFLLSTFFLINPYWFYDGRTIFNHQVIIETRSDFSIPFELNNYEGGRIKVYLNSSEELRLTVLDFDNYLKYIDRETHAYILTEDHMTNFNRTFEIPYKGSFYIVLCNYFILNDDATVDIKIEIFEFNYSLFIMTTAVVILIISSIIALLFIYRQRKIKNHNIKIINLITEKLSNIDDENDVIDFKMYLPDKAKVAKMVSAFCNGYLMNKKNSYIVFGVKDKKLMEDDFTIMDRLILIEMFLEESLKNTKYPRDIESFKIHFIDIIASQFDPVPDSCFNIKTLNLKGYGGINTDYYVIIIEFYKFKLSQPVETRDHKIFIRSEGRNRRATDSDIAELKLKLKRKFSQFLRK